MAEMSVARITDRLNSLQKRWAVEPVCDHINFDRLCKHGHPLPDSNFSFDSKSRVPQHTHEYLPGSKRLHISELNGRSVPASRVTRYGSGLSWRRHSASV